LFLIILIINLKKEERKKIAIFLSHTGRPSYRRSLHPSKENIHADPDPKP
jgi:hypothetical protein